MADDSTDAGGSAGPERLADRVDDLHEQLRATEERPVERSASRWIGEAQAVAGDAAAAADSGVDESVVRERVADVQNLLAHVETTGDEQADEHVAAAREIVVALLTTE